MMPRQIEIDDDDTFCSFLCETLKNSWLSIPAQVTTLIFAYKFFMARLIMKLPGMNIP
jgi:hypothetical protein